MGLCKFNRNNGKCQKIEPAGTREITRVYFLLKLSQGEIWVGSRSGLYKFQNNKLIPLDINSDGRYEFEGISVKSLYQDRRKNIWIGTTNGIFISDPVGINLTGPEVNNGFPSGMITSIIENEEGKLWVRENAPYNKFYSWDDENKVFSIDSTLDALKAWDIAFDSSNDTWVGTHDDGVIHISGDQINYFRNDRGSDHGLISLFTNSVYPDRYDNIWIEGDELYKKPGSRKKFKSINSDKYQVISVYVDENAVWYCSNEPHRWSKSERRSYPILTDVKFANLLNEGGYDLNKRIYKLVKNGNSVIFSSIRNVHITNDNLEDLIEYSTNLPGAFRDFIIDQQGYIWLPGDHGNPFKMNLKTGEIVRLPELSMMKSARTVAQDLNGGQWWGSENNGLFYYHPKNGDLKHFRPGSENPGQSIISASINDILVHSSGEVWLATKLGLDRIDPSTMEVENYTINDVEINTNIVSLLEDKSGNLWAGTEDGLLFINPRDYTIRKVWCS